jgi:hypothetical protein
LFLNYMQMPQAHGSKGVWGGWYSRTHRAGIRDLFEICLL